MNWRVLKRVYLGFAMMKEVGVDGESVLVEGGLTNGELVGNIHRIGRL